MNAVFLDYDGVVNTPLWGKDGICKYGFPEDNKVNNFQCVQWVSEFCEKYDYSIVVTSTWRAYKNYIDCLVNGGLRSGIKVLGKTPMLHGKTRGEEIKQYLSEHTEIDNFLIFDDDSDMDGLDDHLVLCSCFTGFGYAEFEEAGRLHEAFKKINRKREEHGRPEDFRENNRTKGARPD